MNKFNQIAIPLLLVSGQMAAKTTHERPNVILILADDMGYAGVNCFGGKGVKTPAIDNLAKEGVVCTNFHTNAPVSSPTRVSILTGMYQQRTGLDHIYSEKDRMDGLDPIKYTTFVKMLQQSGYHTGIFGKWHLGQDIKFNPTNYGFDEFRGYMKGNIDFISHINTSKEVDWWHNKELKDESGYASTLINKHAVDFIKESTDKPFFMYISHAAIHVPMQGPNDAPLRTSNFYAYRHDIQMDTADYRRRYREMVYSIDEGLQAIIKELNRQGKRENTLIIFLSDNGAEQNATEKYPSPNGDFRGWKGVLYEGGTRVPAIFSYPKRIKQHKTTNQLLMSMDLMPTILEFCGVKNKTTKVDGESLTPLLLSGKKLQPRKSFWANRGLCAMTDGNWKLVWSKNRVEFFNITTDPYEKNDLHEQAQYKQQIETMKSEINQWWKGITKGTKLESKTIFSLAVPAPLD
ncbi:MAG: sulfatase-like hydrolase/transferase [Bacteroidales bacterium]|nr:sulfatase-like hydrolase/transferase [Bacteroidales bacterium]